MSSGGTSTVPATSWSSDRNLGLISPITGNVTKFRVAGCPTVYNSNYQFILLKGTFTNGGATTSLTEIVGPTVGNTISNSMTADRYYTFEENVNTSINAGDQLMIGARRSISSNSTYYFLRMTFTIIIEESSGGGGGGDV